MPMQSTNAPASGGQQAVKARQAETAPRRAEGTLSLAGTRFEIPSRLRHLSEVHVRYARWDLHLPGRLEATSSGLGELAPRGVEQTKQLSLGALHFLGGSQIDVRNGPLLQVHQRHVRLQTSQPLLAEF